MVSTILSILTIAGYIVAFVWLFLEKLKATERQTDTLARLNELRATLYSLRVQLDRLNRNNATKTETETTTPPQHERPSDSELDKELTDEINREAERLIPEINAEEQERMRRETEMY